jgi:hypothetical protein
MRQDGGVGRSREWSRSGVKLGRHEAPTCEHGEWRIRKLRLQARREASGAGQPRSVWANPDRLHPLIPPRHRALPRSNAAVLRASASLDASSMTGLSRHCALVDSMGSGCTPT